MARALWLPRVLRAAGLPVVEWPGWQTRGRDAFYPRGTIVHATASSRRSTPAGDIAVLLGGSATAPPPIAQLYLARDGTWYVIASGACNHALVGWAGPHKGWGNRELVGVEAANDNGLDPDNPEPWPAVQYDSYAVGVAAIHADQGWPVAAVAGHKEHQPPGYGHRSSKHDPTFAMDPFRSRVGQHIAGAPAGGSVEVTPEEIATVVKSVIGGVGVGISHLGYTVETMPEVVGAPGIGRDSLARANLLHLARQLDQVSAGIAVLLGRPALVITDDLVDDLADRIGVVLAARPDNPLGEADKPAIREAVAELLRYGIGAAAAEPAHLPVSGGG